MTRSALVLSALLLLAACNKPPAAPAQTESSAAPASGTATAPASATNPTPDLSGEPQVGTVESVQGAATTEAPAPTTSAK